MVAAAVNPTIVAFALGANVVTIVLAGAAFWRFGRHAFRRAVREEVEPAVKAQIGPTLTALEVHTKAATKGQKKLSKQLDLHRAADDVWFDQGDESFAQIQSVLTHLDVQGTEAAAKVTTLATEIADRVATVATATALAAEKTAEQTALAAEKIAAQTADKVAEVAAVKAVALLEAARRKEQLP